MIDSSYFWQSIVFLGLGTIIIRCSFIFMASKIIISERLKEIFSFIPAAILPALLVPMAFYHQGEIELLWGKERLFVLILAGVVCYKTKSMFFTICFGLVGLYLLKMFFF